MKLTEKQLQNLCFILSNAHLNTTHTICVSDFAKRTGNAELIEQALENEAAIGVTWTPKERDEGQADVAEISDNAVRKLATILDTCFIPSADDIIDFCRQTDVPELNAIADEIIDEIIEANAEMGMREAERKRELGL